MPQPSRPCRQCGGTGQRPPGAPRTRCPNCNGTGVQPQRPTPGPTPGGRIR